MQLQAQLSERIPLPGVWQPAEHREPALAGAAIGAVLWREPFVHIEGTFPFSVSPLFR